MGCLMDDFSAEADIVKLHVGPMDTDENGQSLSVSPANIVFTVSSRESDVCCGIFLSLCI
jgi:hypothetical protein